MRTEEQAFITPAVFRWAIARAKSSSDKIAEKLRTNPTSIASWAQGKDFPTFSQAQRLAEVLYIPFGYLFLPAPPEERIPLTDFRVSPGKRVKPTAELIDLVNDVLFKQGWYSEFLRQRGAGPMPFVGRFSFKDSPAEIAASIRSMLHLDTALRQQCPGPDELLRALIRNIEAEGILVMRSGVPAGNTRRRLSVKEFRGFAISDPIAPLIFVNSRDWPKAQLFTTAHELVHIWIGTTGISNEDLKEIDLSAKNKVERLCNETAAEVLAPSTDFLAIWDSSQSISENIGRAVRNFKVSTLVALRRAFDLRRITEKEYVRLYEHEEQRFRQEARGHRKGGGNFYNNILARNSETLTRTVVQGALSGSVLYRDAARLLNVGTPTVQKIARHLMKPKKST